jgi:hypothetical protein
MTTYRIVYRESVYRYAFVDTDSESAARQAFIDHDVDIDIESDRDIETLAVEAWTGEIPAESDELNDVAATPGDVAYEQGYSDGYAAGKAAPR